VSHYLVYSAVFWQKEVSDKITEIELLVPLVTGKQVLCNRPVVESKFLSVSLQLNWQKEVTPWSSD
jgi:hypothetical protein